MELCTHKAESSLSQFPTKNFLQILEIKEVKEQCLFCLFVVYFDLRPVLVSVFFSDEWLAYKTKLINNFEPRGI